mmetsp:Transcript_1706/g.4645  ORF Transcript_1706/g.4645 Transcript_1706/m.4645 type:complete len:307 (-) Transcript_1706:366-1286(-)
MPFLPRDTSKTCNAGTANMQPHPHGGRGHSFAAALAAATAAAAAALTAAGATTHRRCASCAGSLSDACLRHVRGMSGGAWQTCPALLRPGACLDGGSCRSSGRLRPAGGGPSSRPSSSIFADITLKGARGAAAGAACRAAAAATACAPICVAISALSSASSSSRSSSFSSALSSALSSSLSSSLSSALRAASPDVAAPASIGGVTGQTGSTLCLPSLRVQGSLTTERIGIVRTLSAGNSGALIWMQKRRLCVAVRTFVPSRRAKETSPRSRRASTWQDSAKGCSPCRSEMASPLSYTTAALSLTAS